MEVEVTMGEHELIFVADGYYALKVNINVTSSGVECLSAEYGEFDETTKEFTKKGDASCDACATKENGVCITNFDIHGYLKPVEEEAPPPTGYTTCDWVNSAGKGNLVWAHVLALLYKYQGLDSLAESQRSSIPDDVRPPQFPDTVEWKDVLGTLYYYQTLYSLGDAQIGCGWASLSLAMRLSRELLQIQQSRIQHKSLIEKILNELKEGG